MSWRTARRRANATAVSRLEDFRGQEIATGRVGNRRGVQTVETPKRRASADPRRAHQVRQRQLWRRPFGRMGAARFRGKSLD